MRKKIFIIFIVSILVILNNIKTVLGAEKASRTDNLYDVVYSGTMTREEIENDQKLNELIRVEDADSSFDADQEKNKEANKEKYGVLNIVYLSNEIDNKKGNREVAYGSKTEIPVIPMDLYTTSINKVPILDVDFINTKNKNDNKFWKKIRGLVSTSSHIALFGAAALFLTMIIWRGIIIVSSSLNDNPQKAAESKKVINNWIKSILMLVGVYFIMSLSTEAYKQLINVIVDGNDSVFMIRLNVEDTYSFNTNIIGYIRFLATSNNTTDALAYSVFYCIAVATNYLWFALMFMRMVIIAVLTVVAPFSAVITMNKTNTQKGNGISNFLHFQNWIRKYLKWMLMPLLMVLAQRFMVLLL